MNLKFSFFSHKRDNEPKPGEATWDELVHSLKDVRKTSCTPETCKLRDCEEKNGEAWSPASYPPGTPERGSAAVDSVCALTLDLDHVPSDELLLEYLGKIPYRQIIHASHSDRPGDRCVRVVIALSRPVPGAQWGKFWTNVIAHLGIPVTRRGKDQQNGGVDTQTKDAARLFFLPSRPSSASAIGFGDGTDYLFASNEGPDLNVDDYLHEPTQDPLASPTETPVTPRPTVSPITQSLTGDGRSTALALLHKAWPERGQRHDATLALTGALAHANWSADDIATFVQDLRELLYPEGDPTPTKAQEQAKDSARKVESGEAVSGWPTMIQHIGEEAVSAVTAALGIGNITPQWVFDRLIKKGNEPRPPSQDMLEAALRTTRNKLVAKRTNIDAQLDARMLKRILDREQPWDQGDDRVEALAHAITALLRYVPVGTTPDQVVGTLSHVFPVDVGQGEMSWKDTLLQLIASKTEMMAEEANEEFEVALTGANAGKPINNTPNLDVALKKLKVQLRYDEFADREIIERAGLGWETIEDHHVASLRIKIDETFKFKPSKDDFYDYLTDRSRSNSCHPPREYFAQVEPTWDGKPRMAEWLITYCQAEDTPLIRAIGRLVLVAAVRRVREPGCKFDEMLILEGDQGVQKSTGLQALCPNDDWFHDDLPLDEDTKKQMEATAGKLIIEAGELKGMTKGDVNKLKGFLSRRVDKSRMSYGRKEKISPRQFIIIGTTNDAHYLRDPTGNRRFWPVKILMVDVEALRAARDQIWAEAAHYESLGESIRLDPALYGVAAEEQESRRMVDTIELVLEEALAGHTGRIKSTDIWTLLGKDAIDAKPDEQIRMGDAMRRLGWESKRMRVKGHRLPHYVKGAEHEQNTSLGVSGRKVVKAAGVELGAAGGLGAQPQVGKGN